MQSTFESFDDQILQSFSVQEQHANVHLRSGRHRRCWDANCLRPHRIVLEIDRSDLGEMAGSCLIFCSFASGGDGLVIFKITLLLQTAFWDAFVSHRKYQGPSSFCDFCHSSGNVLALGWLRAGSVSRAAGFHLFYFKQKYQKIWPIDFGGHGVWGNSWCDSFCHDRIDEHSCFLWEEWWLKLAIPRSPLTCPFLHIPMLHRHRIYLQHFARLLGCGVFLWNHRLPWSPTALQGLAFE